MKVTNPIILSDVSIYGNIVYLDRGYLNNEFTFTLAQHIEFNNFASDINLAK